jgi:NADH-quinone oxidoreductase subunit F
MNMNHPQTATRFHDWRQTLSAGWDETKPCLKVCDGTGCRALGSRKVLTALRDELRQANLDASVDVVGTGCPGFCECGPLITIYPERVSYQKVKLSDVHDIVAKTLTDGTIIERLLYTDPQTGEHIRLEPDLPFYQKQKRLVLDFNGRIDPTRIEDYVALGGYASWKRRSRQYRPSRSSPRSRPPACAGAVAQASRPAPSGNCADPTCSRRAPATSSATLTKAIPVRSWIARWWRAIRIP